MHNFATPQHSTLLMLQSMVNTIVGRDANLNVHVVMVPACRISGPPQQPSFLKASISELKHLQHKQTLFE